LRSPAAAVYSHVTTPVPTSIAVPTCAHVPIPVPASPAVSFPVSVAYPDSSQATVVHTFPTYTSFDSLFPRNYFPTVGSMPTTLLIHSLVHALQWTSSLLRGMLFDHPLPPILVPVDQIGRAILMATPLWPGDQFDLDSDLDSLLAGLPPLYTELLSRGSYRY